VSSEPEKDAQHLARMIDGVVRPEADGSLTVPSGSDRADFVFLTREALGLQFPGVSLTGAPERGGIALVFVAGDLNTAEKAVGTAGARSEVSVVVPPSAANGVLLAFVAD
jgi:hypothetical protein